MKIELRDVIYIFGIIVSAIITFFGTKHGLKEYVRDNHDALKNQIHQLEIKLQEHKAKDDLQQQVIEQIGKQMDQLIPKLINQLAFKDERK